MKAITLMASMLVVVCANAAVDKAERTYKNDRHIRPTPEQIAADWAKMGGRVVKKGNGVEILLCDVRKDRTFSLSDFPEIAIRQLYLPVSVKTMELKDGDAYGFALSQKSKNAPAVIVVEDDPKHANLAVYPEDQIAVVNVAKFKDKKDAALLTRAELWRAIGFSLGGYELPMGVCVMTLIRNLDELDGVKKRRLSPMRLNGLFKNCEKFDLRVNRPVPYVAAVQQGWAPPPTNDIQKAIWDKAHEIPTKPIKIEFDPKTDKK